MGRGEEGGAEMARRERWMKGERENRKRKTTPTEIIIFGYRIDNRKLPIIASRTRYKLSNHFPHKKVIQ